MRRRMTVHVLITSKKHNDALTMEQIILIQMPVSMTDLVPMTLYLNAMGNEIMATIQYRSRARPVVMVRKTAMRVI